MVEVNHTEVPIILRNIDSDATCEMKILSYHLVNLGTTLTDEYTCVMASKSQQYRCERDRTGIRRSEGTDGQSYVLLRFRSLIL